MAADRLFRSRRALAGTAVQNRHRRSLQSDLECRMDAREAKVSAKTDGALLDPRTMERKSLLATCPQLMLESSYTQVYLPVNRFLFGVEGVSLSCKPQTRDSPRHKRTILLNLHHTTYVENFP